MQTEREPTEGPKDSSLPAARRQAEALPSAHADTPSLPADVALKAESAPTAPENPLLQRYRGHRTRTWGDAEALKALNLVAQGWPKEHAAIEAGIPVSAIIRGHGPASEVLCDAMDAVYAHEGAAHFEALMLAGAEGRHDPKAASYVRMGLEVHGRLRDREAQGQGQAVVTIHVLGLTGEALAQAAEALLSRRQAQAPS